MGNIEPAESVIQHVEDVLFNGPQPTCKPLFPSQHLTNRIVKLDEGVKYCYPLEGLNQSDEYSALVHYIQVLFLCINYKLGEQKFSSTLLLQMTKLT